MPTIPWSTIFLTSIAMAILFVLMLTGKVDSSVGIPPLVMWVGIVLGNGNSARNRNQQNNVG